MTTSTVVLSDTSTISMIFPTPDLSQTTASRDSDIESSILSDSDEIAVFPTYVIICIVAIVLFIVVCVCIIVCVVCKRRRRKAKTKVEASIAAAKIAPMPQSPPSTKIRSPSSFGNAKVEPVATDQTSALAPMPAIAPASAVTPEVPEDAAAAALNALPATSVAVAPHQQRRRKGRVRKLDDEDFRDSVVQKVQLGPKAKVKGPRTKVTGPRAKATPGTHHRPVEGTDGQVKSELAREVERTRHGPGSTKPQRQTKQILHDEATAVHTKSRRRRRRQRHTKSDAHPSIHVSKKKIVDITDETVMSSENTQAAAASKTKGNKIVKAEENIVTTAEVQRISRRGPSRKKQTREHSESGRKRGTRRRKAKVRK